MVHRVLERQRGEQLGPPRDAVSARCGRSLGWSPQGRAEGRVAFDRAGGPHSCSLTHGRLAVVDGVTEGGIGSALQRTTVLKVHHGQALAAVGDLHVWFVGLGVTGAAGRRRLNHGVPRYEKQIFVFGGRRGQASKIHQPVDGTELGSQNVSFLSF